MKEIGSEFWDVPLSDSGNGLFPQNAQWYMSGRSALKAIACDLLRNGVRTIAMPSWCCESMIKPLVDMGLDVSFYPVYVRDHLVQEYPERCDSLFVMDYFGYTCEGEPKARCVVRDITHSVFSGQRKDADYVFGSLRKWCGVWTGGYAWTGDGHVLDAGIPADMGYVELRRRAMEEKRQYICHEETSEQAKHYLEVFAQAERRLDNSQIAGAVERDTLFAHRLDIELIKKQRRANAQVLMDALEEWTVFSALDADDCPMFVPILVPDGKRDVLRGFLSQRSIYCPIHWPLSTLHTLGNREKVIYENEISIVCDQRYTVSDMERIIDTIREFWKEH